MLQIADIIVSFLFLPVTLFIIIPLTMLCGWLLFKLALPQQTKRDKAVKKEKTEEVVHLTELN